MWLQELLLFSCLFAVMLITGDFGQRRTGFHIMMHCACFQFKFNYWLDGVFLLIVWCLDMRIQESLRALNKKAIFNQ